MQASLHHVFLNEQNEPLTFPMPVFALYSQTVKGLHIGVDDIPSLWSPFS